MKDKYPQSLVNSYKTLVDEGLIKKLRTKLREEIASPKEDSYHGNQQAAN